MLSPHWLSPLGDAFDRSLTEPVEFGFTVPPRHGKTELLKHGMVRALMLHPEWRILYAVHTAKFAREKSVEIKRLARDNGIDIARGSDTATDWLTTAGGGLMARGVQGDITGRGFNLIVVDDPIKSHEQANSPTYREKTWNWLTNDVWSRPTPNGSVIVVHTRWHPDDVLGRMESDGISVVVRRCIAEPGDEREVGTALAPELGWTVEKMEARRRRVTEHAWASLYQGRPRPRGGRVFNEPSYYTALPEAGIRYGHGVDLAYTAKTQADYSVVASGAYHQASDTLYVVQVVRRQVSAPDFSLAILGQHSRRPGPILFRGSGTEKGTGQFIAQRLPRGAWRQEQATSDKLVSAMDYAAAWNDGRVLLPDPGTFEADWNVWVSDFVDEHEKFTGQGDAHDDQVDAASSMHRILTTTAVPGAYSDDAVRRRKFPRRRM